LAGPACAATLRVDSALVVFPSPEPDAAGSIELQARLTDLPIDERRFVRLDVGGSTLWAHLDVEPGEILTMRSGAHDTLLQIDRRQGRLRISEPDGLTRQRNPLLVAIGQDAQGACAVLQLRERDREHWVFEEGKDTQFPCLVRDAPEADRTTLPADQPVALRFRVRVAPGAAPDGARLRLVRRDDLAAPGAVLCELLDAGGAGDDRAGDGVYGCATTLGPARPGPIRVIAEGALDGERTVSPSLWLRVESPPAP
jgi:hypothetical protein